MKKSGELLAGSTRLSPADQVIPRQPVILRGGVLRREAAGGAGPAGGGDEFESQTLRDVFSEGLIKAGLPEDRAALERPEPWGSQDTGVDDARLNRRNPTRATPRGDLGQPLNVDFVEERCLRASAI
jgi:hypothetical protein